MNDDCNLFINIMHYFYYQRIMRMYLLDQNIIQRNEELAVIKQDFDLLLNKSKGFECQVLIFFSPNEKKVSSRMAQIS